MPKFENSYRAICTNRECKPGSYGHFPNEPLPKFCPKCGYGVISACPACNTPIEELIENPYLDPPNHCMECGEKLRHSHDEKGYATGATESIR